MMCATRQKSFDFSLRIYRHLLRLYPTDFRKQYGSHLTQVFGDLALRAIASGGAPQLILLWMRILPDGVVSAIREHLSAGRLFHIRSLRLRWILACAFGLFAGAFIGDRLVAGIAAPYNFLLHGLCVMLVLGFLQSAWALRRSAVGTLVWMAATALGLYIFALPYVWVTEGFPPTASSSLTLEIVSAVLWGTGVGFLQFLLVRNVTIRAWRWIPANAFASLTVRFAAWMVNSLFMLVVPAQIPYFVLMGLTGLLLGYVSSIPLESMFEPEEENPVEGALQS